MNRDGKGRPLSRRLAAESYDPSILLWTPFERKRTRRIALCNKNEYDAASQASAGNWWLASDVRHRIDSPAFCRIINVGVMRAHGCRFVADQILHRSRIDSGVFHHARRGMTEGVKADITGGSSPGSPLSHDFVVALSVDQTCGHHELVKLSAQGRGSSAFCPLDARPCLGKQWILRIRTARQFLQIPPERFREWDKNLPAGLTADQAKLPLLEINILPGQSRDVFESLSGVQSAQDHPFPFRITLYQDALELWDGEGATLNGAALFGNSLNPGNGIGFHESIAMSPGEKVANNFDREIRRGGTDLASKSVAERCDLLHPNACDVRMATLAEEIEELPCGMLVFLKSDWGGFDLF